MSDLVNRAEAMRILGISESHLKNLIRSGELPEVVFSPFVRLIERDVAIALRDKRLAQMSDESIPYNKRPRKRKAKEVQA
jgi:hypothetical protein